jgi:hypothetical protein
MTADPHPRLDEIERDECLRLLAGDEIGRRVSRRAAS